MVCGVVLAQRVVVVGGEGLVCPVQRAERGLDRAEVLGAEFAEGAERFVYAVE